MNDLNLLRIGTSGLRGKGMKSSILGSGGQGRCHRSSKRYCSWPPCSCSFSSQI